MLVREQLKRTPENNCHAQENVGGMATSYFFSKFTLAEHLDLNE